MLKSKRQNLSVTNTHPGGAFAVFSALLHEQSDQTDLTFALHGNFLCRVAAVKSLQKKLLQLLERQPSGHNLG